MNDKNGDSPDFEKSSISEAVSKTTPAPEPAPLVNQPADATPPDNLGEAIGMITRNAGQVADLLAKAAPTLEDHQREAANKTRETIQELVSLVEKAGPILGYDLEIGEDCPACMKKHPMNQACHCHVCGAPAVWLSLTEWSCTNLQGCDKVSEGYLRSQTRQLTRQLFLQTIFGDEGLGQMFDNLAQLTDGLNMDDAKAFDVLGFGGVVHAEPVHIDFLPSQGPTGYVAKFDHRPPAPGVQRMSDRGTCLVVAHTESAGTYQELRSSYDGKQTMELTARFAAGKLIHMTAEVLSLGKVQPSNGIYQQEVFLRIDSIQPKAQ